MLKVAIYNPAWRPLSPTVDWDHTTQALRHESSNHSAPTTKMDSSSEIDDINNVEPSADYTMTMEETIEEVHNANQYGYLVQFLIPKISDNDLRSILSQDLDDDGRFKDVEFVFQFVPRKFRYILHKSDERVVPEDVACHALMSATKEAVLRRFSKHSVWTHGFQKSEDDQWEFVLYYGASEPQLPESLESIPTFKLESQEEDWNRRKSERRAQRERERELHDHVTAGISNEFLREIIVYLCEKDVTTPDMEYIFRFVPRTFGGYSVSDQAARSAFMFALEDAVFNRIEHNDLVYSLGLRKLKDGHLYMVINWVVCEPELPSSLQNMPQIQLRREPEIRPHAGPSASKPYPEEAPEATRAPIPVPPPQRTLGFVGLMRNETLAFHVAVTTGHLFDDGDYRSARLSRDFADFSISPWQINGPRLQILPSCLRGLYGRPAFRQNWNPGRDCLDEICLLNAQDLTDEELIHYHSYFGHHDSARINCNFFFSLSREDEVSGLTDPGLFGSKEVVKKLRSHIGSELNFQICKFGAKTGATFGNLVAIEERKRGLNQGPLEHAMQHGSDSVHTFELIIDWIPEYHPFSDDGDSGSLVYALRVRHGREFIVPLGILQGSNGSNQSRAWLLASWCDEIYLHLDWELLFCHPLLCSHARM